ncbi:hypothetical protein B566_EDAN016661 [Ephemera danica]|nr:hypothetical protein B566_EDAN016661 [Ephemera danica]
MADRRVKKYFAALSDDEVTGMDDKTIPSPPIQTPPQNVPPIVLDDLTNNNRENPLTHSSSPTILNCVKYDSQNLTSLCTHDKNATNPPKCVNCGREHHASYKGCKNISERYFHVREENAKLSDVYHKHAGHPQGKILPWLEQVKYLGVTFDKRLT